MPNLVFNPLEPAWTDPLPKVVNFRDVKKWWQPESQSWSSPALIYIGRRVAYYSLPASVWANPFRLTENESRGATLDRYRAYILQQIKEGKVDLAQLRGKTLVCWCKPQACHGDVLVDLFNEHFPLK